MFPTSARGDPAARPGLPRRLWIALAVALGLRLVATILVPLIPEEAYYWVYSQHLQLSFFDHPPMVAWVVGLGTSVLGHTELGARIGAATLMAGASLLMFALAGLWFDRATAVLATLLLQVLPVYVGIALLGPMDAALCFFWLACLIGVSLALQGRPAGWYLAGVALGGALLSKYSAVFLPMGVLLAVAGHRRWRGHLRTIHPYAGLVLAVACFSPVIAWNAEHDWASFRFQFFERYAEDPFNLRTLPLFLATQLLVLSPVGCAAVAFLAARGARRRGWPSRYWFAVASGVPSLAAATLASLRSDVHVHWTAPAYLGVIPAACAMTLAHDRWLAGRGAGRLRWQPAMLRTAGACALVVTALLAYLIVAQPRLQLWPAFGPWHEVAAVVEEQARRLEASGRPPRVAAAGKYRLASVLAFYRMRIAAHPEHVVPYTTSQWIFEGQGLGFEYWSRRSDWVGEDVICVGQVADRLPERLRPWFESMEVVDDPRLTRTRKHYSVVVGRRMKAPPGHAP
jgi:dolichol-phosphate mannosyltransferase